VHIEASLGKYLVQMMKGEGEGEEEEEQLA
jgi:hypothetical protein